MKGNVYIYIFGMALITYLIRVSPLVLIRKQITNKTLRSFLYYVPYVTLAVMTFPEIITSTSSPWSGLLALIVAMVLAWSGRKLFTVAIASALSVFLLELIII